MCSISLDSVPAKKNNIAIIIMGLFYKRFDQKLRCVNKFIRTFSRTFSRMLSKI